MSETKINLLDLDRDAMRAFFVENWARSHSGQTRS